MLGRAVAAICPAQKFDQFTPDAWLELLGDLRYEDARAAVFALGKAQPFIAPCDIRGEVARLRKQRLDDNPMPEPDPELTVPEYLTWLRTTTARIADGDLVTKPLELNASERARVDQLVAGGTRTIPGESV